jgi:hypothetical protein
MMPPTTGLKLIVFDPIPIPIKIRVMVPPLTSSAGVALSPPAFTAESQTSAPAAMVPPMASAVSKVMMRIC